MTVVYDGQEGQKGLCIVALVACGGKSKPEKVGDDGYKGRCSAGGGGAGASPGVVWGAVRPPERKPSARPGKERSASRPRRKRSARSGLLTRSGPGRGPPRPCSVQAGALLAQGLVFVLPSGTRSWEARRLVLGGAAAPIAAPSPWGALAAVSAPSLGLAAPPPVARPLVARGLTSNAWLPWPSRGQPLRRRAARSFRLEDVSS